MVGVAEIGLRLQCFGKDSIPVKLSAVTQGDGVNHAFERLQGADCRPGNVFCFEVGDFVDNDEFDFPLYRNQQSAFLTSADDGVHLEIADTPFLVSNDWILFDAGSPGTFPFVHTLLPYFLWYGLETIYRRGV